MDKGKNPAILGRMYSKTTHQIRVTVRPQFLAEESVPALHNYVWAYHVRIENLGADTVQLRNRYWRITDGFGQIHEVRGRGVVGEEPVLTPGDAFEYTSGTPLPSPSGMMCGTYEMEAQDGRKFEIDIPSFSLDSPYQPQIVVH
jgi:ApaG protein